MAHEEEQHTKGRVHQKMDIETLYIAACILQQKYQPDRQLLTLTHNVERAILQHQQCLALHVLRATQAEENGRRNSRVTSLRQLMDTRELYRQQDFEMVSQLASQAGEIRELIQRYE